MPGAEKLQAPAQNPSHGSHRIASELGTSYIGNPHEVPNLLAYLLLPPYYLTPEPLSVCLTYLLPGRELNNLSRAPLFCLSNLPISHYLSIHPSSSSRLLSLSLLSVFLSFDQRTLSEIKGSRGVVCLHPFSVFGWAGLGCCCSPPLLWF